MGRLPIWRHLVVLAFVLIGGLLALVGLIGSPWQSERYSQWQIVIEPGGGSALNITETIDYDMGRSDRHGARRLIPTDFGEPQDITATATDAPDDLHIGREGADVEVRIGDPDVTVRGQHRYVLGYRLPDAKYSDGRRLAVDLTGNLELPITTLRGTFSGFELSDTACYQGRFGSRRPCEITKIGDGVYQVELHDLSRREYVTIEGTVDAIVDPAPVEIAAPPMLDNQPNRGLTALLVMGVGSLSAFAVFLYARRRGRNVVYSGGPTDAALPPPNQFGAPMSPASTTSTNLVTDTRVGEMATTEFVPPAGVAPWEGAVVLNERFDDSTLQAYISGLAANEVVTFQPVGSTLAISAGPRLPDAPPFDQQFVYQLLSIGNPFITGTYDSRFASLMSSTKGSLLAGIRQRHWWRRGGPKSSSGTPAVLRVMIGMFAAFFFCGFGGFALIFMRFVGLFGGRISASILSILICGGVAFAVYAVLLPSRSAAGSAVALQTESFRRFLHASEAQHVEWAWQQGLLREYSAWAVALGEAAAWSRALRVSTVPPQDHSMTPLFAYSFASSFSRSSTAPSSSGGGGGFSSGGGFSGGGSAGGGGGGGGGGGW